MKKLLVLFFALALIILIMLNLRLVKRNRGINAQLEEIFKESSKINSEIVRLMYEDFFCLFVKADTSCFHCQNMTKEILIHDSEFQNLQIFIVYSEDTSTCIKVLNDIETVFKVSGSFDNLNSIWKEKSSPFLALFSPDRELIWAHSGEVSYSVLIEKVMSYASNEED